MLRTYANIDFETILQFQLIKLQYDLDSVFQQKRIYTGIIVSICKRYFPHQ